MPPLVTYMDWFRLINVNTLWLKLPNNFQVFNSIGIWQSLITHMCIMYNNFEAVQNMYKKYKSNLSSKIEFFFINDQVIKKKKRLKENLLWCVKMQKFTSSESKCIHLSIYLSIHLLIYLSIYLLSIYISIYLFVDISMYLSIVRTSIPGHELDSLESPQYRTTNNNSAMHTMRYKVLFNKTPGQVDIYVQYRTTKNNSAMHTMRYKVLFNKPPGQMDISVQYRTTNNNSAMHTMMYKVLFNEPCVQAMRFYFSRNYPPWHVH